jgi:glutaminyl-peptide cyclotransferase
LTTVLAGSLAAMAPLRAGAAVPEYSATVVATFPHDPAAFTEGLLYRDGFLYESTGQNGQSFVRQVRLETGAVLRQRRLDAKYFGEGIVVWKDRLIELTWQDHIGFIYDLATFAPVADFHYPGEGWALTRDASHVFMSDGTGDLRILDPDSLTETGRIHVTCDGNPVRNVNELEWVKGEIYANIWLTTVIVRIDPATGAIVGLIDLADLTAANATGNPDGVLNGIAYDAAADRLFVTGKLWPHLYQITLVRRPGTKTGCRSLP